MAECIFCKIINKETPSEIVYEDEKTIAFKDINPKAPVHILIIPKKHIASIIDLKEEDKDLIGEIIFRAKKGREGGQIIDHLHLHLLGGMPKEMP